MVQKSQYFKNVNFPQIHLQPQCNSNRNIRGLFSRTFQADLKFYMEKQRAKTS